jgi:lytic murein transglycosylase
MMREFSIFVLLGLGLLASGGSGWTGQAWAQDFTACVAGLRADAAKKGVSNATLDRAFQGLTPDPKVLELQEAQPEFVTPVWDYLATLVDDERIADGRAMMRQWAPALAMAEQRFGVDRSIIAAVWGVETDFGRAKGTRPLVQSLATLSCSGRRQAAFRPELLATLLILERGDVRPDHLVGSWAGAFGHTQFMPSTFLKLAVDMDGDGRADIVDSVPDALGSTANFLRAKGWQEGGVWGFEVAVPAGLDLQQEGRRQKRPMRDWTTAGVTLADGRALPPDSMAGLIAPAGLPGPAFLVTGNFDAVVAYNASVSYALAIVHLADRMRGGAPFAASWPTDDPGLSRAERRELQRRLQARGYDIGVPDGAVGEKTRRAIGDIQMKSGRPVDGRPGKTILEILRAGQ